VDIIVEFQSGEHLGVEDYGVDFIIFSHNGKDSGKSIVRGIGFHNKLCVQNPMHKNRHRDEDLLQIIKCQFIFVVKIPQSVLSSKMSE